MARAKRHYIPGSGKNLLSMALFPRAKDDIGLENTYLWDIKTE
jgi:hypothetical protein